jgi:hypothetical protein
VQPVTDVSIVDPRKPRDLRPNARDSFQQPAHKRHVSVARTLHVRSPQSVLNAKWRVESPKANLVRSAQRSRLLETAHEYRAGTTTRHPAIERPPVHTASLSSRVRTVNLSSCFVRDTNNDMLTTITYRRGGVETVIYDRHGEGYAGVELGYKPIRSLGEEPRLRLCLAYDYPGGTVWAAAMFAAPLSTV